MSTAEPGVQARAAAATLLGRVLRGGAFSNMLKPSGKTELDKRHARELLFGCLRDIQRVERAIGAFSSRSPDAIDDVVFDVLRIGAFELISGREAHAAVNSSVEAAKLLDRPKAAGFVNALLREISRRGEPALPEGRPGLALRLGQQEWVLDAVIAQWGEQDAVRFFEASRIAPDRMGRIRDAEFIADAGAPSDAVAGSVTLSPGEVPDDIIVQDASSVAVGWAVHPQPGDVILDMAAAPGGKTLHLWDQVGERSTLIGSDRHSKRVTRARRRLEEAGATVAWTIADGRRPPFREATFDRVLVDAPCTGLGTLRRRPEIAHKVTRDELERLAVQQRRMLDAAIQVTRPGGVVVYSVCTILAEESVEVVEPLAASAPAGLPGRPWGKGLLLAPHVSRSDGMFISVISVD